MVEKSTDSAPLTIGRLSFLAEVDATTVRFYERSGLLEAQERTQAGYRLYSRNSLARIQFIRRARETGYSLDQIRQILQLHDEGGSITDVQQFATIMVAEVEEKIRALNIWRQLFTEVSAYFEQNGAEHIDGETVDILMRNHCDDPTH